MNTKTLTAKNYKTLTSFFEQNILKLKRVILLFSFNKTKLHSH